MPTYIFCYCRLQFIYFYYVSYDYCLQHPSLQIRKFLMSFKTYLHYSEHLLSYIYVQKPNKKTF